jgi:hypothetical protein
MELTISNFFYNTCREHPKPSRHKFNALFHCTDVASLPNDDNGDCTWIVTSSGSASEFYIEPMLSCVNDYDVMHHRNDWVAIPTGHSVPRCLPAEFHHHVKVFLLIDTEFPGYVIAELVGDLINDDYYECCPTERGYASTTLSHDSSSRNGPARKDLNASRAKHAYKFSDEASSLLSLDRVYCIRCLVWPPQAADWSARHRKHGWPDLTTVERIVNNGCDVVQVSHPQCRQDDLTRQYQWRFSFSRAETVLLNSWSVEQQIVYHVLRIFIKTVGPTDGASTVLNNYIIKTMMLWTCELVSPMKWKSRNIIDMCRILIHELASCVKSSSYRSYFITRQNILENLENTDELNHFLSEIMNVTNESLCLWLIDNYIRQCVETCPPDISRLFHDNRTVQTLPLSLIAEWRLSCYDDISHTDLRAACFDLQRLIFKFFSSAGNNRSLCKYTAEHLQFVDSRLLNYYYALCFLRVLSLLERGQSALRLADVLIALIQSDVCVFSKDDLKLVECLNGGCISSVSCTSQSFTVCNYFQTASVLLSTIRLSYNKVTTLSRLLNEISKIYLHSALQCAKVECENFHFASRCLLNVLLSCLYWSTGQRNSALIHSDNATSISPAHRHRIDFCYVQRQLLPCFDKTLETILGLIQFYKFLQHMFLDYLHRNRHDDVFTADLLAFYLTSLNADAFCYKTFGKSRGEVYNTYKKCLMKKRELAISDVLLFQEIYRKTNLNGKKKLQLHSAPHARHTIKLQSAEFNTTGLSKLLVQSAVEHLTAFRVSESRDFSSVRHIMTNDFEAMYAYKCHLYEKCFHLCEENVDWLLLADAGTIIRVFLVKESNLLHLVDDDCLSLISLTELCGVCEIDPTRTEAVNQLTLSMYLLIQYKLKLMHSSVTIIEALHKVMIVLGTRMSERSSAGDRLISQ